MLRKFLILVTAAVTAVAVLSTNVLAVTATVSGQKEPGAILNQMGTIVLASNPQVEEVTGSVTFYTPLKGITVYLRK